MKLPLFVLILITQLASAQPKMIVDQNGLTSAYILCSKDVYSINELPSFIADSARSILAKYMGDSLSKKLTFSIAQIIDTSRYLKSEKKKVLPPNLPKYEMAYNLRVPEIGIKGLTIELRLTQYGKKLKLTWPRKGVKDISVFLPLDTIRTFALVKAKKLKFQIENCKVDFIYDEQAQKFLWQFKFPNGEIDKDGAGKYDCISVNWLDPNDFTVDKISVRVVY